MYEEGDTMSDATSVIQIVFQAMTFVVLLIDLIVTLIKATEKK